LMSTRPKPQKLRPGTPSTEPNRKNSERVRRRERLGPAESSSTCGRCPNGSEPVGSSPMARFPCPSGAPSRAASSDQTRVTRSQRVGQQRSLEQRASSSPKRRSE
jgi:hypothetical protein